jgi:transposase
VFATGALDSHNIGRMLLRYRYRLYPDAAQRDALARAFGCARVVYNDGLRLRQEAFAAGPGFIDDGGRDFVKIDRFAPTSKTCSSCGTRVERMPLRIREWDCPSCGMRHDRDVNAARNILALGRRERLNACGEGGRPECVPAAVDEAGTDRSEGTPL